MKIIDNQRRALDTKLTLARDQKLIEEAKMCTFKPNTRKLKVHQMEIPVRGLETWNLHKNQAAKIKENRIAREKTVFRYAKLTRI